jgi:pSer/pThr/pTyr-binding forkhead associated (FHA) protein
MPSVFVLAGKSRGQYHPLTAPTTVIGRGEDCDIQILDDLVSRRHLQIRMDAAERACRLVDLGSANGTFIGDQRISETELRDGDVISVGGSRVLYTTRDTIDPEEALNLIKYRGEKARSTLISPSKPPAGEEPA